MATLTTSLPIFLCLLLFLFTFSSAQNVQDPFSSSESESKPETTHSDSISKPLQSDPLSLTVESTAVSDAVPLKFISFRPINRHVPGRKLPLYYRFGRRHRCHQGHRLQDPRNDAIPYGNDAILRSDVGEERRGFDPANGGGRVREVPSVWTRLPNGEPRFPDGEQRFLEMRGHHHKKHHHREQEHEEGGFMKRIRMFFGLF